MEAIKGAANAESGFWEISDLEVRLYSAHSKHDCMLQKCTSSLVNYSLKEKSLPIVFYFVSPKVRFGEKKLQDWFMVQNWKTPFLF